MFFQVLFANIVKRQIQRPAHVLLHARGYTDSAWISYAFQSRGHVHSITEDVAVVDDDVALVNTQSEINSRVIRHLRIARGHLLAGFPWRIARRPPRSQTRPKNHRRCF